MPGTSGIAPYGSCMRVDVAARFLGAGFGIEFDIDATHPVCQSSRTVVSALPSPDPPQAARKRPANAAEGTIRKQFAESIEANSVHGSDSPETAAQEISFFFAGLEIVG